MGKEEVEAEPVKEKPPATVPKIEVKEAAAEIKEEVEAEPVKEEPPAAVPVTAPTSYKHTWTAKPLGIGLAKTNTASPSLRVSKVKRADLSSVITVGDTLLSVDGVDATGWSLQDAFAVMKAWSGATPLVIEFGSQKLKAEEVKVAAPAVEPVAEKAEVKVVSAEKKAEADVVKSTAAVPVEKQTKVVKPEVVPPVAEPVAKKVEEAVQLSVLDMAKAAVRAAKAAHQHQDPTPVAPVPENIETSESAESAGYSYTFTSKPLGISLASVAGAIVVKKVKRPGCPIGVGHTLTSVNGKDVVALKWA